MDSAFKSALNSIKADKNLIKKTEGYLMENVSLIKSEPIPAKRNLFLGKRVIAAACAALLLFGGSIGAYAYYKTPVSYLSLDINPSVELGINPFGKVVSATAYNADGSTILKGQNLMNSSVQDAVKALVQSADKKGFIAKDGSTVISATSETDNSTTASELQNEAENGADEAVESEGAKATVQTENVALERRDEARKLGVSPGKLNLIEKLQKLDPSITVDQYKDAKVTDIMKKFVELKKEQNGSSQAGNSSQASSLVSSSEDSSESSPENQNHADNSNAKNNSASNNSKSKNHGAFQGTSSAPSSSSEEQTQAYTATPSSSSESPSNGNVDPNSASKGESGKSQESHGNGNSNSHKK